MQLFELFDQPATINLRKTENEDGDVEYTGAATLSDGSTLEIEFSLESSYFQNWTLSFKRGNTYKKNFMGNEIEVFSTVFAAINRFVIMADPAVIQFTATKMDEENDPQHKRARAYEAMVKRLTPKQYETEIRHNAGFDSYRIIRRRVSWD